jgi:hypothetical protein
MKRTTPLTLQTAYFGDKIKTIDGEIYIVTAPVIDRNVTTHYYCDDRLRNRQIVNANLVQGICGAQGTNAPRIKQLMKQLTELENTAQEYEFFTTEGRNEEEKLRILDGLFEMYERICQTKKSIAILF